ncbi:MAG: hypothetical protein M3O30_06230 [Planctomycetota bacterium]|nr:hypothetical protein [Planctomycetota bacterium]
MNQNADYPQWYRTFRTFVFGMAAGALLVYATIARSDTTGIGIGHLYILSAIINIALFSVTGTLEAVFAIRRHRRLLREQRNSLALS